MRVLYALDNFPVLSESYIRTELEYVRSQGVEVKITSEKAPTVTWDCQEPVESGVGIAATVAREWKPDVIHVHWTNIVDRVWDLGIPVTVRGHSFEFNPQQVSRVVDHASVRKVFLFPHQTRVCAPSPKIESMACAYSPERYFRDPTTPKTLVTRIAAGLPGKDLEGFIRIAAKLRTASFVLAITTPFEWYVKKLQDLNTQLGGAALIVHNYSHDECANLMRQTVVYLRGHDLAGHPYGMPVSIAEAMACGCFVVGLDDPDGHAREFIGDAGVVYTGEDEAALLIANHLKHGLAYWKPAVEHAELFRADRVLPRLLYAWGKICERT